MTEPLSARSDVAPLTHPWTVFVTLKVWADSEGNEPIVDAVENALRPILGKDESMQIDVQERS